MKKLSIITVCYNSESHIERAIKSVVEQKTDDIEYIVVDGKSTDGTVSIIKKYIDDIDVFISEKDCGIWDAMNKGIKNASGEYIGFLNSDDFYYANALEKVIEEFRGSDISYLMGGVKRGNKVNKKSDMSRIKYTFTGIYTSHSVGFFLKRKIFNETGYYNTNYHSADWDHLLKIYDNGFQGKMLSDVTVGEFSLGGYSESVPTISSILQQAEMRRLNGFGRLKTLFLFLAQYFRHFRKI